MPAHRHAKLEDATLTQTVPTEYSADAVIVLIGNHGPAHAIVVEVQLRVDEKKRFSWPVYTTSLRARRRCPTSVLVIAPDPKVAAWAGRPIELGLGSILQPLVIGPEIVPRVTTLSDAMAHPELAVLSVLAHGRDEPEELAPPALQAVASLDAQRAKLYADLILSALGPAARIALEETMKGYQYQSEFAKQYYGEGLTEGRQEGLEEGREQGERQAYRQILTDQLEQRFGSVPESWLQRIAAEADLQTLRNWLARVPSIASPDELT